MHNNADVHPHMVALPALKLLTLGVRQITRPVVKKVVYRATASHGLTYKTCIVLGRVSLGLSGVIAEWSRKELERSASERKHATPNIKKKDNVDSTTISSTTTSSNNNIDFKVINKSSSSSSPKITPVPPPPATAATVKEHHKKITFLDRALNTETPAVVTDMETKRLMEEAIAVATRTNNLPLNDKVNSSSDSDNSDNDTTASHKTTSETVHNTELEKLHQKPEKGTSTLILEKKQKTHETSSLSETEHSTPHVSSMRQVDPVSTVTPRSRSLLQNITYGPLPKWASEDEAYIFLNASRSSGEAARLFIRHPYRSTWYVFSATFLAPFPEKELVAAGAELLMELLVFVILASILIWELRQQSLNAAKKEAYLEDRLKSMENKINELVRLNQIHHDHASPLHELETVPEYSSTSRLEALAWPLIKTADLIAGAFHSLQGAPSTSSSSSSELSKENNNDKQLVIDSEKESGSNKVVEGNNRYIVHQKKRLYNSQPNNVLGNNIDIINNANNINNKESNATHKTSTFTQTEENSMHERKQ